MSNRDKFLECQIDIYTKLIESKTAEVELKKEAFRRRAVLAWEFFSGEKQLNDCQKKLMEKDVRKIK